MNLYSPAPLTKKILVILKSQLCQFSHLVFESTLKTNTLYSYFHYTSTCPTLYSPAYFNTQLQPILNFAHVSLCNVQQTSTHTSLRILKFWYCYNIRLLSKHCYLQSLFLKDWISSLFAKSVWAWWALKGEILTFGSQDLWKMHFQSRFWLQRTSCPWLINTILLREYYGLVIKYMISHLPNRCIKVGNKPAKSALFVVHTIFFL